MPFQLQPNLEQISPGTALLEVAQNQIIVIGSVFEPSTGCFSAWIGREALPPLGKMLFKNNYFVIRLCMLIRGAKEISKFVARNGKVAGIKDFASPSSERPHTTNSNGIDF